MKWFQGSPLYGTFHISYHVKPHLVASVGLKMVLLDGIVAAMAMPGTMSLHLRAWVFFSGLCLSDCAGEVGSIQKLNPS